MSKINRWHVGPALLALALALVACEDSITGIPEPVFEAAPVVEALTAIAPAHGGCVAPGAGLVSWWTGDLDGDYSDFLGTNPIARYQGVLFQPGVVDGAFRFQGMAGHYMEIDDSSTLRPANFTVGLWAERRGEGQRATDIYGNMLVQKAISNPSSGGSLWSYFVSWRSDGTLAAGVYFDNDQDGVGGPVRIQTDPAEPFLKDVPIFIALSVAGPDNALVVNLSVNGVVKGTFNATGLGAVTYGDGDMVIGNQYAELRRLGFHRTFDGIIDEVDIFDRALSIEDIQAMYAAGSAGRCKTPEPVNTAPVVDAGEDGSIDEGGTFETYVQFTDDDSEAWTASVDYGDGSGVNPTVIGTGFDLSHTYAQDGTFTVTVTVKDDLGARGSSSASVVVSNVAPTVDAGPDATIFEGATFESAGSFEDPGVEDAWTATVDYGDGSGVQPLALSGVNFELSHTYANSGSGPFTVTVTVADDHYAGVGKALLSVEEVDGGDDALVFVVYPLTIKKVE